MGSMVAPGTSAHATSVAGSDPTVSGLGHRTWREQTITTRKAARPTPPAIRPPRQPTPMATPDATEPTPPAPRTVPAYERTALTWAAWLADTRMPSSTASV